MLLAVLGVFFILRLKVIPGLILFGVGLYFLAPELGYPLQQNLEAYWPLLLIFLGIGFFFKRSFHHERKRKHWQKIIEKETADFNNVVIFGSESKKINSYDFQGGKILAVFGGMEIDLTNCTLNKENNLVELVAVFGGITFIVPKEWNVKSQVVPVMGGIEDNGKANEYVDPAAEFFIKGVIVCGGIEIKRV
jgi:predicted membrane protein